jgi:periplasmic divalent cation tolerance protein
MDYIIVLVTTPTLKEATHIATSLVEKRIAACTNIVSNIQSVFRWKGRIEKEKEHLLIIKSRKMLLEKLVKTVKSMHSYEVPEIVAIQIIDGNKDFLNWLKSSVKVIERN